MKLGIVGAEKAKFTDRMEQEARQLIRGLLRKFAAKYPCRQDWGTYSQQGPTHALVSGGCHLGGIDIWAVEEARALGWRIVEHLPRKRMWSDGYKERNEKIAQDSDELHVIVVDGYHERYVGDRHPSCYHCHTTSHVKSGACWTAKVARKLGVPVYWHLIQVTLEGA
jgi:hypothetical protein